jgi:uncharacterized membrane protein HdeD (DUF308 family)
MTYQRWALDCKIAAAIRLRRDIEGEWWLVLSGLASIVFARIVMWNPAAGALGLLWVIASFAIAIGVVLVMLGFKVRGLRRYPEKVMMA